MQTLIVGDIHGKVDVVERALAQEHPVLFVGDIADSYDKTLSEHLECFRLIFDAIDAGKASCLYGNHELSYMMPQMRCSGWDWKMADQMDATPGMSVMYPDGGLRKMMATRFDYFHFYEPNILICHGGLDKRVWKQTGLDLASLPQVLTEWCADPDSPAYWIGQSRGGSKPCGGIFWCDFDREFQPIDELIQIVGHTRGQTLRTKGENFCVDYNDYKHDLFYYDLPE